MNPQPLPPEFIAFWRDLCAKHHRTTKSAHQYLQHLWRTGCSIPGYGTWPVWFAVKYPDRAVPATCVDHPRGWSYCNLMKYRPTKEARMLLMKPWAKAAIEQQHSALHNRFAN